MYVSVYVYKDLEFILIETFSSKATLGIEYKADR